MPSCTTYSSGNLPLMVVEGAAGEAGENLTENFKDISDNFGKALTVKLDGSSLSKSSMGLKVNTTGLAGDGFPRYTREQMLKNNGFWEQALPPSGHDAAR